MAKNRNTFEKRRREMYKKQKADEKRERRRQKKEDDLTQPAEAHADDAEGDDLPDEDELTPD